MPFALRALVLVVLAQGVSAVRAGEPAVARVAVEGGRVTLHAGDTQRVLVRARRAHVVRGAGRLVLGPGARAEVSWARRASLRLRGPLELSWKARGGGALGARVDAGGSLEWEVRGVRARMELVGFALDATAGVVHLGGAPGGAVDAVHHGGDAVRIRSLVKRPPGTWPARLRAGGRVRLEPARDDG